MVRTVYLSHHRGGHCRRTGHRTVVDTLYVVMTAQVPLHIFLTTPINWWQNEHNRAKTQSFFPQETMAKHCSKVLQQMVQSPQFLPRPLSPSQQYHHLLQTFNQISPWSVSKASDATEDRNRINSEDNDSGKNDTTIEDWLHGSSSLSCRYHHQLKMNGHSSESRGLRIFFQHFANVAKWNQASKENWGLALAFLTVKLHCPSFCGAFFQIFSVHLCGHYKISMSILKDSGHFHKCNISFLNVRKSRVLFVLFV